MLIIPAILTEKSEDAILQLAVLRGVVPWVQIDVMDSTMTNTTTFDLYDLVGEVDDFDVEVHLMVEDPVQYFEACDAIGASRVYFSFSAVESPSAVLRAMDPYGFTKGISLAPQTHPEEIYTYIDEIDAVQIMTVEPGQQGAVFLEDMLTKVPFVRDRRTEIWVSVDGGVNLKTVKKVAEKQIDAAGVGSAISHAQDPIEAIQTLAIAIEEAEG